MRAVAICPRLLVALPTLCRLAGFLLLPFSIVAMYMLRNSFLVTRSASVLRSGRLPSSVARLAGSLAIGVCACRWLVRGRCNVVVFANVTVLGLRWRQSLGVHARGILRSLCAARPHVQWSRIRLRMLLEGDIGDPALPPLPRKIRQSLLKCLRSDP